MFKGDELFLFIENIFVFTLINTIGLMTVITPFYLLWVYYKHRRKNEEEYKETYKFTFPKLKQSEINAIVGIALSLVINYYVWYLSPFNSLAKAMGLESKLIWVFIWGTLVGAGFSLMVLNKMYADKNLADKK